MTIIQSLQNKLNEYNLDGFLVMSSVNRRYISGFTGTSGAVLLTKTKALFITDFRYVEQAESQVKDAQIVKQTGTLMQEIFTQVNALQLNKLGFEKTKLTYAEYEQLDEFLAEVELVPVENIVESLRLFKTDAEIETMKEAAAIAEKAYEHIQTFIKPGVKEIDVSNELEMFMRKQGAVSSSFDIIVASGARSALPHGVASDKVIQSGELVTLDFGAYYNGYCSDITRTLAVGDVSEELKNIYEIVRVAQQRGIDEIKPGMTGKEADALTRDYITEQGYGEYFGHSTGHGLGMEVHEAPGVSLKSDVVLKPGMVVTVEPGIYIPGVGGVRIEDDILITESGNERLNYSAKDLIVL
ncbi:M24 family metallopeptidase [Shouchella sp. JSM 1781072]|uniref:M24 family metallopeptidase n=1 Tax=Bacillaceae TaxID=186817 RepID=UPI000C07EF7E|nr:MULTISPECIES: Xaa-Pro peptidase family protein [Bacillaceae]UTR04965.1 Xaa-Pro peptidase family protein [Alkalihalobacillus sp. LMS6]